MLHVAPDLSGVIPLNAFEAQAASVRDLAAGVMDVSGVAGTALKEMQEVRDAGQWAQARDGMYRFEQDVMRELEAGGDSEHLQERWKKALSERLPSYLPARMSGPVRERVAMARENLETAGSICRRCPIWGSWRRRAGIGPGGWSLPWSRERPLWPNAGLRRAAEYL